MSDRVSIPIDRIFGDRVIYGIQRRGNGSVTASARVKQFDRDENLLDEEIIEFQRNNRSYRGQHGNLDKYIDRDDVAVFQVSWQFNYNFTLAYPWATQLPFIAHPGFRERFLEWAEGAEEPETSRDNLLPEGLRRMVRTLRKDADPESLPMLPTLFYQWATGTWSNHSLHHTTNIQHSFERRREGGWEKRRSLPDAFSPERSANCSVEHECASYSSPNGMHNDSEVSVVIGLHGLGSASVSAAVKGVGASASNRSSYWETSSRLFKVRVFAEN